MKNTTTIIKTPINYTIGKDGKKLSTVACALRQLSRYCNKRLTGDMIGVEDFNTIHLLEKKIHNGVYNLVRMRHNSVNDVNITTEKIKEQEQRVYDNLRKLSALIGPVNGLVIDCAVLYSEAYTRSIKDSTRATSEEMRKAEQEKKSVIQHINYFKTHEITEADIPVVNGVRMDLTYWEGRLAVWNDKIKELKDEPDNAQKDPTQTAFNAFRLNFECAIGGAINGQAMKSAEEIASIIEAKRKARRERNKREKAA